MSETEPTSTMPAPLQQVCPVSSSSLPIAADPAPTPPLPAPSRTSIGPSRFDGLLSRLGPYVAIARVDHWFKNAFMLLGTMLALFYHPRLFAWSSFPPFLQALAATCLIASSNYVLNEILDGPTDRLHPSRRHRPVPSGQIRLPLAYFEWASLGAAGLAFSLAVNRYFAGSALALWVMGIAYNVPPLRTKEWPYRDVLSESANNGIRLFLGWFALVTTAVPPLSLTFSYWMLGAFFMATKRFAEYRQLADAAVAAAYRRSFRYYTAERLLVSMFFY